MKQICYSCGRDIDRCECERHHRRPGHRASDADGKVFAEKHPDELLNYMLQSDCLTDILRAYQEYDSDLFLHMACCAAELYADNYGIERIG